MGIFRLSLPEKWGIRRFLQLFEEEKLPLIGVFSAPLLRFAPFVFRKIISEEILQAFYVKGVCIGQEKIGLALQYRSQDRTILEITHSNAQECRFIEKAKAM